MACWRRCLLVSSLAAASCGGAPSAPTDVVLTKAPESSSTVATTPAPVIHAAGPSAVALVRELGGARLWAVVDTSAFRDHPLGDRLEPRLPFARSLAKAGIDGRRDIDRILLADQSLTRHHNSTAIYEHHIDPERLDTFLTLAIAESEPVGRRAQIADHPCAVLNRHQLVGTACIVSPTLFLIAVEPDPAMLRALAHSSGVPLVPPGEAVHATFLDPSDTLEFGSFKPPAGLGTAELGMRLAPSGGIDLALVAPSDDPVRDADALRTELGKKGAAIHLGPIPLPAPPVQVEAIGPNVVATLPLSKSDLDIVIALIELTVPI